MSMNNCGYPRDETVTLVHYIQTQSHYQLSQFDFQDSHNLFQTTECQSSSSLL